MKNPRELNIVQLVDTLAADLVKGVKDINECEQRRTDHPAQNAVSLYILHNVFYASFSFIAGWFADWVPKNLLLAIGYALGGAMALAIIFLPVSIWTFALIFISGGVYVAIEETLEDSLCAELVEENHHGMAFGVLATVNGVGDFISSIIVGALWSAAGARIAFAYSAVLFFCRSAACRAVANSKMRERAACMVRRQPQVTR